MGEVWKKGERERGKGGRRDITGALLYYRMQFKNYKQLQLLSWDNVVYTNAIESDHEEVQAMQRYYVHENVSWNLYSHQSNRLK